jgi:2-(1,2-epoxy-1,2-dihydrophenyl)acetyl-CoA isomerase
MKQNLLFAETNPLQTALDAEAVTMQFALQNEDHFEAVAAFVEKRTPKFQGR